MKEIAFEKIKNIVEEHTNTKNKILGNEKNPENTPDGLYFKLKKLEEYKKENEDAFKGEFPEFNIKDTKPILFTDKIAQKRYEELQQEQEKLEDGIKEIKGEIMIIKTDREN